MGKPVVGSSELAATLDAGRVQGTADERCQSLDIEEITISLTLPTEADVKNM